MVTGDLSRRVALQCELILSGEPTPCVGKRFTLFRRNSPARTAGFDCGYPLFRYIRRVSVSWRYQCPGIFSKDGFKRRSVVQCDPLQITFAADSIWMNRQS